MNLAQVVQDAIRGRARRSRDRQHGALDSSPPAEFLQTEVWPLLREARTALESRDYIAIALQPSAEDETQSYTLLILDSSCRAAEYACFLRFMILDQQLHTRVRHPKRKDEQPRLLEPSGSIMLVQDIIEEFVFECLKPRERKAPASAVEELTATY